MATYLVTVLIAHELYKIYEGHSIVIDSHQDVLCGSQELCRSLDYLLHTVIFNRYRISPLLLNHAPHFFPAAASTTPRG